MGGSHLKNELKPLGLVLMPYVMGISEKFKHTRNHYNIRIDFKIKSIHTSYLQ